MITVQKRESVHPRVLGLLLNHRKCTHWFWSWPAHRLSGVGYTHGLGLGVLLSSLLPHPVEHVDGVAVVPTAKSNWALILIGIFFIVFGMGIVLALFPYIIAFLLILLGIWVLIHGFVKPYYISLRK